MYNTKFTFVSFLDVDWFIGTNLLINKNFPIIFEDVKGTCIKENHSFHNYDEVTTCMRYVNRILGEEWNGRKVLPSHIGIHLCNLFQRSRIESNISSSILLLTHFLNLFPRNCLTLSRSI